MTDKGKRYSIVSEARVCFNCLNRHSVSKCKSRNRYKVCHRKHHTSLCQNVEPPPPVSSNESTTTNKISGAPLTDKTAAPSVSSYHIGDTDRHTPVLLKTAVASVGSHNNHVSAHILFDESSQRSFITSDAATKLDLKPEMQETISLSTFGGTTSSVKRIDTATIYLETTQEETIPIRVIIVPTIAAPLTTYTGANVRDLPHLKGVSLAQVNIDDSPFTVDILVGADHYWDIVENEVIKGPGPTAAKSKIGYLSPANSSLVCILITIGDGTDISAISTRSHLLYFAKAFCSAGSTPKIANKNIQQRSLSSFLTISVN